MKKGQKVLVIEPRYGRNLLSSESWIFYGELAERVRTNYGKVIEAINFSTSPLRQNIKSGELELYFDGIVLVKIRNRYTPTPDKTDYGVGVFWTESSKVEGNWAQYGFVCSLSDKEGKRYLREDVLGIK